MKNAIAHVWERVSVTSLPELKEVISSKIDTIINWGTWPTKTPKDLFGEIKAGDSYLVEKNGEIIRCTNVLVLDVCYQEDSNSDVLILEETKQVFVNGSTRVRNIGGSLSEKFSVQPNTDIHAEIIRATEEELWLSIQPSQITAVGTHKETKESPSYPGLSTEYSLFFYRVYLNKEQFNQAGYVEVDENIITYFDWKK